MAEHSAPVNTGISDIEHVSSREPSAIVAVNDPVLSPTDIDAPTDSLLWERIMTPASQYVIDPRGNPIDPSQPRPSYFTRPDALLCPTRDAGSGYCTA